MEKTRLNLKKSAYLPMPLIEHIYSLKLVIYLLTCFDLGTAMSQVGDSFRQLSEIKDSLDVGVKQDFLDPLQQLVDKDIKEVMVRLKK